MTVFALFVEDLDDDFLVFLEPVREFAGDGPGLEEWAFVVAAHDSCRLSNQQRVSVE